MNEIVKYNNDLNFMPFPNFTGHQFDLFFSILSQIKEKHDNLPLLHKFFDPTKRQLVIPYKKFVDICRISEWNRSFTEVYKEIKSFLNILLDYKINYSTPNGSYYAFVCFEEAEHDTGEQVIRITFQKKFFDMVVNHTLGFTRFELAEFIALRSKYSKTLYRLLKQYRQTGYFKMDWQQFKDMMQIPKGLQTCDIDKGILNPCVLELTQPKNLFDSARIPFENLSYTKIKGTGRGRGGFISAIEFHFTKQNDYTLLRHKKDELYARYREYEKKHVYASQNNQPVFMFIDKISILDNLLIRVHLTRPVNQSISNIKSEKAGYVDLDEYEFSNKIVKNLYLG